MTKRAPGGAVEQEHGEPFVASVGRRQDARVARRESSGEGVRPARVVPGADGRGHRSAVMTARPRAATGACARSGALPPPTRCPATDRATQTAPTVRERAWRHRPAYIAPILADACGRRSDSGHSGHTGRSGIGAVAMWSRIGKFAVGTGARRPTVET